MAFSLERIVQLDYILVVSQVLQDLHVLCHFLLALNLLVQVTLPHAFNCCEMATELMLGNANFAECAFTQ